MTDRRAERKALWELAALYAAEGIPYGFFAQGLPVLFRAQGASNTVVGLLHLLYLPWTFKPLWAPVVDTWHLPALGRRRTWILGTQLGVVLCCLAGAALLGFFPVVAVLPVVFLVNVLAATQDIAVDGYAVSRLTDRTRGLGNAIQVCGYKAGMVLGGGAILWAAGSLGWRAGLFAVAAVMAALVPVSVFLREPPAPPAAAPGRTSAVEAARATFRQLFRGRNAWALAWLCTTVKVGEAAASAMLKPALVDRGFTVEEIAIWNNTLGLGASLLGSWLGGTLVTRVPRARALGTAVALQAAGIALVVPLFGAPGHWLGTGLVVEHFLTGILTTVLFTFMMDAVDPRFGGTQYSTLAALVVVGTGAGSTLSGVIADAVGYPVLFSGAACVTAAHLLLVPRAEAARRAARDGVTAAETKNPAGGGVPL
ncbi:MAG: MFS transporter [Deltaproteobacteria bacterium]|nr:MFS transporter [Deltaproteobacteria bacterium]